MREEADMEKIINAQVLDFMGTGDGFIFAEKKLVQNRALVTFNFYNLRKRSCCRMTSDAYLYHKFGSFYPLIARELEYPVLCSAAKTKDKRMITVYPMGFSCLFDSAGDLLWQGKLAYHSAPVQGIVIQGESFWSVIPSENMVVRFSVSNMSVDLRLGGPDQQAFQNPYGLAIYHGRLYVCNEGSGKIRVVDTATLAVNDYLEMSEPVLHYVRVQQNEIIVCQSGIYLSKMQNKA